VDELIEALAIFRKYASPEYPTRCEHDVLYVNVDPALVSAEDTRRLGALGFSASGEDCFTSFKFGSC
jgi:hypothetical protein